MLFVVGLVVAVPVFVEVDGDDLGVVDVEVVSTLKYNTNNYVANWSANYYPWVVAMKEFMEMFKMPEKIQAKMRYENRLFSISFDFFKFSFFKIILNFYIYIWKLFLKFEKKNFFALFYKLFWNIFHFINFFWKPFRTFQELFQTLK